MKMVVLIMLMVLVEMGIVVFEMLEFGLLFL